MSSDDESDPNDDSSDADPAVDALLDAYALKDERRTGWQLRGVDAPSRSPRTRGVAYLVLALGDRFREDLPGIDLDRALRLAVVHDVAEAETGDAATRADSTAETPDPAAKEVAERAAMEDLADALPDRIRDAWEAYEARESPEAILVRSVTCSTSACRRCSTSARTGTIPPTATGGVPRVRRPRRVLRDDRASPSNGDRPGAVCPAPRAVPGGSGRDVSAQFAECQTAAAASITSNASRLPSASPFSKSSSVWPI